MAGSTDWRSDAAATLRVSAKACALHESTAAHAISRMRRIARYLTSASQFSPTWTDIQVVSRRLYEIESGHGPDQDAARLPADSLVSRRMRVVCLGANRVG